MIIKEEVGKIVEKYLKEKNCIYIEIGFSWIDLEENKFINYGKYKN